MTKKRRKVSAESIFRDMAKEDLRVAKAAKDEAAHALVNVLADPPTGCPLSSWLLWGSEVLSRAALAVEAQNDLERL